MLRFRTIEQNALGGTLYHFPRGKVVMTWPVQLPLVGKVTIAETSKEMRLDFWQLAERDVNVKIHDNERLEMVTKHCACPRSNALFQPDAIAPKSPPPFACRCANAHHRLQRTQQRISVDSDNAHGCAAERPTGGGRDDR